MLRPGILPSPSLMQGRGEQYQYWDQVFANAGKGGGGSMTSTETTALSFANAGDEGVGPVLRQGQYWDQVYCILLL